MVLILSNSCVKKDKLKVVFTNSKAMELFYLTILNLLRYSILAIDKKDSYSF
jgi:hypothetical protein